MKTVKNGILNKTKGIQSFGGLLLEYPLCAMPDAKPFRMLTLELPLQTPSRGHTIEQKLKVRRPQAVDLGVMHSMITGLANAPAHR